MIMHKKIIATQIKGEFANVRHLANLINISLMVAHRHNMDTVSASVFKPGLGQYLVFCTDVYHMIYVN